MCAEIFGGPSWVMKKVAAATTKLSAAMAIGRTCVGLTADLRWFSDTRFREARCGIPALSSVRVSEVFFIDALPANAHDPLHYRLSCEVHNHLLSGERRQVEEEADPKGRRDVFEGGERPAVVKPLHRRPEHRECNDQRAEEGSQGEVGNVPLDGRELQPLAHEDAKSQHQPAQEAAEDTFATKLLLPQRGPDGRLLRIGIKPEVE